jgi:PAS domain S-box-containing protein
MIALDIRTVTLLCVIAYVVSTLFVAQLWRQNRRHFAGMGLWACNFALLAAGLMLIILRGAIPDWVSIVLPNISFVAAALLMFVGLERFLGKPGEQRHNYALLAACGVAFWFYSIAQPDLPMRGLIVSVALLIMCGQCVWLLWHRVAPEMRRLTFGVGMVFVGYCVLSVLRIVEYGIGSRTASDFFQWGHFNALVLVAYQTLAILLTYSLVLMVNQRLIVNIDRQRERFAKAFHAAPYAITLTRLSDGTLLDVNENFEAISGYSRAEVIGKPSTDLNLWQRGTDRAAVIEAISSRGEITGVEMQFRSKSGQPIVGLLSAQVIPIGGENCILSCIADISERAAKDEALQRQSEMLRLRNEELDRFNRLAVGRELEMIRLKQEINALSLRLGQEAPYRVEFAGPV